MSKYQTCFNEAFNEYQAQSNRPGYRFGWFSWLRHDAKLYPHIAELIANLNHAQTDDGAREVLQAYFINPLTKFNNHSFAIYLLDSILMKYPEERNIWEQYYPPEKNLIFYNGPLFRGMKILRWQLDEIFRDGLESREVSNSVDDYAKDTTMALGISTSKSADVAQGYATAVVSRGIREAGTMIYIDGYLLKINYTGEGGIDILQTLEARGENISAYLGASKKEVNIVGAIKSSDIEGAWYVGRDDVKKQEGFIRNPHFLKSENMCSNDVVMQDRLRQLFSSKASI